MTTRNEEDAKQLSDALNKASGAFREHGKSAVQAFQALTTAAKEAAGALEEFRVACYPNVPDENHSIVQQMRRVAETEGKVLRLIPYPRHIPDKVFGQTYIVYDEVCELDWLRRTVVNWRGKRMVYRREILLPRYRNK